MTAFWLSANFSYMVSKPSSSICRKETLHASSRHPDIPRPVLPNELRADVCVSIYLPTTPITQDIQQARITLSNLAKEAIRQLQETGTDKRRLAALQEHLDDLADDEEFWRFQAHSLARLRHSGFLAHIPLG